MPKRDELQPLERTVSDTLDEYLSRLHGITSSWAFPDEFIEFLRNRGYIITTEARIPELEAEVEHGGVLSRAQKAFVVGKAAHRYDTENVTDNRRPRY